MSYEILTGDLVESRPQKIQILEALMNSGVLSRWETRRVRKLIESLTRTVNAAVMYEESEMRYYLKTAEKYKAKLDCRKNQADYEFEILMQYDPQYIELKKEERRLEAKIRMERMKS